MKIYRLILTSVALAVSMQLVGCSTHASSDVEAKAKLFGAPPQGKSGLYVYRESHLYGSGRSLNIFIDKKKIAELGSGDFIYTVLEAKSHTIFSSQYDLAHALATGEDIRSYALRFKTEPDQNYYLEFNYGDGKFIIKVPEEGQEGVRECDMAELVKY